MSDGGTGDGGEDACDLSAEPRFDGGAPIPLEGPIIPNFFDTYGVAYDDLYAVGTAGLVMHWDGLEWTRQETPVESDLLGVWASGPDDIFAVGLGGAIIHSDGVTWTAQPAPVTLDLHAVSGGGTGNAFAVGLAGTIVHTADGLTWTAMASGTEERLNGVWIARGGGAGFAVGNLGTIVAYDGAAWTRQSVTGLTAHLKGVFGFSASRAYACGLNGMLLSNESGAWQEIDPVTVQPRDEECQQPPAPWPSVYLRDMWGAHGRLFIVGWNGTILTYANSQATVYQVTEKRLESVWGNEVIDTPGQGDGGIPDGGLVTHDEIVIVGVSGAVIRAR